MSGKNVCDVHTVWWSFAIAAEFSTLSILQHRFCPWVTILRERGYVVGYDAVTSQCSRE
jgi:hypothetical protein